MTINNDSELKDGRLLALFGLIFNRLRSHYPFLILLGLYILFSLMTLTKYPMVHDDEGILSNFAYLLHQNGLPIIDPNISNHGFFKGLTFFPISSGILFYSSLAFLGHYLGFGLYQLRLQPLFFSLFAVLLTYKIALLLFENKKKAVLAAFFLACSSQFFTISHMIRQEAMLIAILLTIFFLLLKGLKENKMLLLFLGAFLTGLSICIHPNGLFFVLLFFGLLFYQRRLWSKSSFTKLLLKLVLFTLIGGLLFVFVDYLPYRTYYWDLFNAPYFGGHTRDFFHSGGMRSIWLGFWEPRYHRYMLYFVLNFFAIVGGFLFKNSVHRLLLVSIFFLYLVIAMTTHTNYNYYAYLIPFYSMLLSSVIFEIGSKISAIKNRVYLQKCYRLSIAILLLVCLAHPLVTIWAFRNYSYYDQTNALNEYIGKNDNYLAPHSYLFALSREKLFPPRLLYDYYGLRTLISELDINYVVYNTGKEMWFREEDNRYLFNECNKELILHDYRPRFRTPTNDGNEIILFNCANKS